MPTLKSKIATFILTSTTALLVGTAPAAGQDSFFDVWAEVSIDKVSNRPIVTARAAIQVPGTVSKTVDTEILAMDQLSHWAQDGGGPSKHVATISYSVTNVGPDELSGTGFMEVQITCAADAQGERSCVIDGATPLSKKEFKGHVTLLK